MGTWVYLSGVIGALNALLVVVSAGVTLAITLVVSLNALHDNGEAYTAALSNSALYRIGQYFRTPEHRCEMFAAETRRHPSPLPMEHLTANMTEAERAGSGAPIGGYGLERWRSIIDTVTLGGNATYLGTVVWFLDGSQINVLQAKLPGEDVFAVGKWYINSTGQVYPTSVAYDRATKQLMPPTSLAYQITANRPNEPASDLRTDAAVRYAWQNLLTSPTGLRWLPTRLLASPFVVWAYVMVTVRLTNSSGFTIGYAAAIVGLDDLGGILDASRATPGSVAFAVDGAGILLGASGGNAVYNMTDLTAPHYPAAPCVTTYQGTIPSTRQLMVCRYPAASHPDARIRAAADSGLLQHTALKQQMLTAEGTKYFAAVRGVPELSFDVRVVILVPESDILGDAGRVLWIALGAAVGVVVLGAAVGVGVVWLLLRPLGAIAKGMAAAARLEENGVRDDGRRSAMQEIAALQDAFAAMSRELTRIRSFVPQSLLVAGETEDEEEELAQLASSVDPAAMSGTSVASKSVNDSSIAYIHVRHSSTTSVGSVAQSRRGSSQKQRHVRITDGVRRDNVTVLVANLRGFHAATESKLSTGRIEATVAAVLAAVDSQRGVVDSFHGDRFTVSFNAARPAANHGIRGAVAAARIIHDLQGAADAYALPVTCGVVTGAAQVGNVGCTALKRFSIVGPVVSQAACLERMCKLYAGAQCLVPQRGFEDLRTAVQLRTMDYVRLPFAGKGCLVAAVIGEHKDTHDDEWMYQLQGHKDAAAQANAAWSALAANKLSDARTAAESARAAQATGCALEAGALERLWRFIDATAADAGPEPENLGRYYNDVVLS